MSILNKHDWDDYGRQFCTAKPFPSICIDNFLDKEFADSLADSYPQYSDAQAIGKEWKSLNENLKVQITEPPLFPSPVTKLCEALGGRPFLDHLSKLSGINNLHWDKNFRGGGMHLTGPSGILDVHVDFNYDKVLSLYRRLNILIYLNPTWSEEWGGEVELWDKHVKHCDHSFSPIHNRCIIFATSDYSFHGVTAVACPEGMARKSFAAYYYSEDSGNNGGEAWGGNHSTIFRARPYELKKKYWSMPLSSFKKKLSSTLRAKLKR